MKKKSNVVFFKLFFVPQIKFGLLVGAQSNSRRMSGLKVIIKIIIYIYFL